MFIKILRWLAIPVVYAGVAAGCFFAARWAVSIADGRCVESVGGACVEGWHTGVVEWSIYVAIVVGLLAITLLCSWLAPAGKKVVAVVIALLGIAPLAAGYIVTGWAELAMPVFVAALAGLIGIVLIWRGQAPAEGQR